MDLGGAIVEAFDEISGNIDRIHPKILLAFVAAFTLWSVSHVSLSIITAKYIIRLVVYSLLADIIIPILAKRYNVDWRVTYELTKLVGGVVNLIKSIFDKLKNQTGNRINLLKRTMNKEKKKSKKNIRRKKRKSKKGKFKHIKNSRKNKK